MSRNVVQMRLQGSTRAYSVVVPSPISWTTLLAKGASKLAVSVADIGRVVRTRTAKEDGLEEAMDIAGECTVAHGDWFDIFLGSSKAATPPEPPQSAIAKAAASSEVVVAATAPITAESTIATATSSEANANDDEANEDDDDDDAEEEAPSYTKQQREKIMEMKAIVGDDVADATAHYFLTDNRNTLATAIDAFFSHGGVVPNAKDDTLADGASGEPPSDTELQQILGALGEDVQMKMALNRSVQEEKALEWREQQKLEFQTKIATEKSKKEANEAQQVQQQGSGDDDDESSSDDEDAFLSAMAAQQSMRKGSD